MGETFQVCKKEFDTMCVCVRCQRKSTLTNQFDGKRDKCGKKLEKEAVMDLNRE